VGARDCVLRNPLEDLDDCSILFLELNGYRFTASEEDAAQAVLNMAAGILDEPRYAEFLRANSARSRGGS
jgi:prophage maintenance system killer protein